MMAVGVARPRAQGQAMISTAMVVTRACVKAGAGPNSIQTPKVSRASTSTAGTKTPAISSARRWIGALEPWASSTRRTIWARAVSRPTRVARKVKVPVLFSVAPMAAAPGPFSTGRLSPVSIDSSTVECPATTTPSTGTFSPGRTRSTSPTSTRSSGTSTSASPRTTRAVRGARPMRRRMASPVRPRARASK